jgi:transcription elongation factor Elf1
MIPKKSNCKFCGKNDKLITKYKERNWHVICLRCKIYGGSARTKELAIIVWNEWMNYI